MFMWNLISKWEREKGLSALEGNHFSLQHVLREYWLLEVVLLPTVEIKEGRRRESKHTLAISGNSTLPHHKVTWVSFLTFTWAFLGNIIISHRGWFSMVSKFTEVHSAIGRALMTGFPTDIRIQCPHIF